MRSCLFYLGMRWPLFWPHFSVNAYPRKKILSFAQRILGNQVTRFNCKNQWTIFMFHRVILHMCLQSNLETIRCYHFFSYIWGSGKSDKNFRSKQFSYSLKWAVTLDQTESWGLCSDEHSRLLAFSHCMSLPHVGSGSWSEGGLLSFFSRCALWGGLARLYHGSNLFQLSSLAANIFHKYFSVEISGKEFVGRHRLLSCLGSYAFSSVQTCLLTFYENLRCFLLVHFCDDCLLSLLLWQRQNSHGIHFSLGGIAFFFGF